MFGKIKDNALFKIISGNIMSYEGWMANLNIQQHEAVTSKLGNTLILAGAGSGKTRVLVSRIAYLVHKQHISPHAILAVTFTNKAAGEMKARLGEMLNCNPDGLWVGTFHGLCHRLLRRHYGEANLPLQFHILDSDDQLRMIKRVIAALNLDSEQWPAKQAQSFINGKKDEGLRPGHIQVASYGPGKTLLSIYSAYEQACQAAGAIDFAEIILRAHEMLRDNVKLLMEYQQRFQAILVDEFQDTNTIQYAWIRLISGDKASVMAVGDDDQSIYGWRGAKVENIQRFSRDFPDTKIIRLEQNYRSTATILDAANNLIANNSKRMGKELWTDGHKGEKICLYSAFNELEEARFVGDFIKKEIHEGRCADSIAILYRSNAQSRVLEEALLRLGVAYRIHGGVRYFDRSEVKDTLAYLRLLTNVDDDTAIERVLNFPTRGIGDKTIDEMRSFARNNQCSLWQAMLHLIDSGHFTLRATNALINFKNLIEEMAVSVKNKNLEDQIKEVINSSGLHAHFTKSKDEKSVARIENLQELVNAARQFRFDSDDSEGMPIIVSFLAHASLESGETQADPNEFSVNLMTLHSAKGLEFPLVFLVGMEEGLFPSRQSNEDPSRLEEERRLCYVGMTRAMEKLVLSYSEVRRQYGREEYHRPSRFLAEIPEETLNTIRAKSSFKAPVASNNSFVKDTNETGFILGQMVEHHKFGQGIVLAVEGSGAHARIQVNFEDEGTKWLVIAYAKLMPVVNM